jgi:2-desacetyl-2-hydroxyethyl bacteriochlorophyllide A dehydrogenase
LIHNSGASRGEIAKLRRQTTRTALFLTAPDRFRLALSQFPFSVQDRTTNKNKRRKRMRGVVFTGERGLELMQFPDPTPEAHDVVIEMKASGMCGTDLHQYRRPKGQIAVAGIQAKDTPVIVGHEPCGVVVAIGTAVDAREARIGQRVMVHHYQGCTQCNQCRSGWQQLCQEVPVKVYGNNEHGGHTKYLKVPANTLVPLPDELSFSAGAAIACGSGTAYSALRRIGVSGNDTLAIFGQGPVGLAATQYAKAMGAKVIALDISQPRLERAKAFGADEVINPAAVDPVAAIKDLTHGRFADLTLDTSGNPEARLNAIRSVKVWGTMCFVGEGGEVHIDVSPLLMRRQLTLVASWTFSNVIQADCARFSIERGIDVDKLFTHRWNIDQADEAYKVFDKQADGKGVFLM